MWVSPASLSAPAEYGSSPPLSLGGLPMRSQPLLQVGMQILDQDFPSDVPTWAFESKASENWEAVRERWWQQRPAPWCTRDSEASSPSLGAAAAVRPPPSGAAAVSAHKWPQGGFGASRSWLHGPLPPTPGDLSVWSRPWVHRLAPGSTVCL